MNNDQLTEQEIDDLIHKAHYRKRIRPLVYPQHKGRMLIVDLESHDYEIDDHDIVATHRLWQRKPGCLTFGIRIGYKAAYHFSFRRKTNVDRNSPLPASVGCCRNTGTNQSAPYGRSLA